MNINRQFLKGLAVGFFLSLFVTYSFFRLYWITEIGLKYFRWHATLWLYLSIAMLFATISYVLYKQGIFKHSKAQKMYLAVLSLLIGFYVAEGILRIANIGTTYSEQREGVFVNPAERMEKGWYMTHPPHRKIELKTPEYNYPRTTNSEGLSDQEWSTTKDTGEIRIITLGDSFTEGDGSPFDSSYPRLLQGLLQTDFPSVKINVMNAGRIGSDPWFEYKKLKDRLLKYQPDVVIYTNGSNDMFFDHLNYGGMERFLPDSTIKNKIPQPEWLGLYNVSYVFRVIMNIAGYDNTLFSAADRERNKIDALHDSREMSKLYSRLAVTNNFVCVQVIRPDKVEMEGGNYEFNYADLNNTTHSLPNYSTFNLLAYYRDSLHIHPSQVDEYFWKVDQHHNAKGYQAMAKAIYNFIKPEVAKKAGDL